MSTFSKAVHYYKEASYLLDYITDFKDNYIGCQEMLATQKKNQSSYTIDFEFIFDPDDFDYVMEVGAAEAAEKEKAIYDRAVALENSGDYAGAIDLYWQCYYYKDSSEKMKECQREISYQQMEISYQQALAFETKGDLASAISIYRELGEYKDCPIRFESICKQMQNMKLVSIIEEQFKGSGSPFYTTETVYAYDENGVLQTIENKTDTLPYSEVVAVDENGKIISGVLTGQWSSDAQRIMIVEKEYNEYGDIVSEKTTYSSYDNWMHKDGEVAYSTYEYTYDEYGYATQMQEYYNGEEYTLYKYINTYDSDGLLTHMDEYRDGELKYRYDYDYNIAGMLITQTCYSESSSITTRSTYTYESIP